jgi:tRNA threonylcarbamoyladenosine biosynthesis protein TsaE
LKNITTHSEAESYALGKRIGEEYGHPGTLIALSGDLGTGKTVLIRGICAFFECEEQVSSPTFTLINEYAGKDSIEIVHCDLYRLNRIEQMLEIGLDDLFHQDKLMLVEWAEKALPILPVERLEIASFHGDSDTARMYSIQLYNQGIETLLSPPASPGAAEL